MEIKKQNVFAVLNAINCNEHVEKKSNGRVELSYLSWAWAWAEVKKAFPSAFYTIYENPDGCIYHHDGRTAWVKTGVTIEGQEYIEYLPVMDNRNASITIDKITSFDVNRSIQRSLTKACARHGLGLYIYAGEDLPESADAQPKATPKAEADEAAVNAALDEITNCKTMDELKAVWGNHKELHKNTAFVSAKNIMKVELNKRNGKEATK